MGAVAKDGGSVWGGCNPVPLPGPIIPSHPPGPGWALRAQAEGKAGCSWHPRGRSVLPVSPEGYLYPWTLGRASISQWQAQMDASGDWSPGSPIKTAGRVGGIMQETPVCSSVTEGRRLL